MTFLDSFGTRDGCESKRQRLRGACGISMRQIGICL
jgi:hypothetical protein